MCMLDGIPAWCETCSNQEHEEFNLPLYESGIVERGAGLPVYDDHIPVAGPGSQKLSRCETQRRARVERPRRQGLSRVGQRESPQVQRLLQAEGKRSAGLLGLASRPL